MKLFNLHGRFRSSPARGRIFSLAAIVVVLVLISSAGLYQEYQQPAQLVVQQQPSQHKQALFASKIKSHVQAQTNPLETKPGPTMQMVRTIEMPIFSYSGLDQIEAIENLPPGEALNSLRPLLSDPDPVIRLAAIESLATMHYPGIPAALTEALRDPIPQIRIEALEALAIQNDAASISGIEACLFDANLLVRIAAIDTLAELESEAAVNSLASLLGDGDAIVRHHTVNALGEIGGENAISFLSAARYDPDETIRANAESIIIRVGPSGRLLSKDFYISQTN